MQIHPDDLTGACLNAALRIHRKFRSGMLENAYETVLFRTLVREGFAVERQKAISFDFEGDRYENAFRADLIVNGRLIIEVKAQETNSTAHTTQLLTYLRLAQLPLGLVINFGMPKLMDGVKRVVNDLPPEQSPQLRVNRPLVAPVHAGSWITPRC